MERQPNTEYVLSLSYGKDSIACLEAIYQLGLPLDRIVHAEDKGLIVSEDSRFRWKQVL